MIPWLKTFFGTILWDEAAFQRYLAGGCLFVGNLLNHGGSLPTPTGDLVVPGLASIYWMGPWLLALGGFIAVGSLPKPIFAANRNGGPKVVITVPPESRVTGVEKKP